MATTIKLKNGSGAPTAGDLVQGEPALDLTNKRLYTEDSGGTVIEVGTNPGTDVTFADNRKAIFGAGSDLKLYHTGSHSYIDENGTGNLYIGSNNGAGVYIQGSGETLASFVDDGAVTLYHDNSAKLATTSTGIDVTGQVKATSDFIAADSGGVARGYLFGTSGGLFARFNSGGTFQVQESGSTKLTVNSSGIDVTGTVTADGLTVAKGSNGTYATLSGDDAGGGRGLAFTSSSVSGSVGARHTLNALSALGEVALQTNSKDRLNISSGGDISFYEDTGTTAKLFWDASAESLGIGTTSPETALHLYSTGNTIARITSGTSSIAGLDLGDTAGTDVGRIRYDNSNNSLAFTVATNEAMRIDSSGNVGIGTSSPIGKLDVSDGTNPISIDSSTYNEIQSYNRPLLLNRQGNNVGIGTSSPSDALHVLDSSGNAYASIARGTQSQGEVGLRLRGGTSGNDWYVYQKTSSNDLNFYNTADRVTIDASGNVAIGHTSANSSKLHLKGVGSAGTPQLMITDNSSGKQSEIRQDTSGNLVFDHWTGASRSERMRIDSSGNVGIGTDSPSGALHVSRSGLEAGITLERTTSATAKFTMAANDGNLVFTDQNQSAERMRIDSSGNVGIGTSSVGAKLHVSSGTDNNIAANVSEVRFIGADKAITGEQANLVIQTNDDMAINKGGSIGLGGRHTTSSTNGGNFAQISGRKENATSANFAGYLAFGTSDSASDIHERMRIDSSGNLLVGTTDASGTTGSGIKLTNPTSPADDGKLMIVGASTTIAQDGIQMYSTGASAYRFFVQYSGQINATSTSINAISDVSLKENIRDLDKGLETILALQPRRFDWKNGDGNDIMGFVAQEVETVLPELVHDYKYNDEETKLGLKMGDMIPSLVKAIQEQNEIINDLRARVAQLEGAN